MTREMESDDVTTSQVGTGRKWRIYHPALGTAGQLDAVIESDVNILDIAALSLIISEAGGVFSNLEGGAIDLETRSVLSATPALHAQLLSMLN